MKQTEIKVGEQYQAKVSGQIVVVRVDAIREAFSYHRGVERGKVVYDVTNLRTGRALTFKSAAKFRRPVSKSLAATIRANNDNKAHEMTLEQLGMTMPSAGKQ